MDKEGYGPFEPVVFFPQLHVPVVGLHMAFGMEKAHDKGVSIWGIVDYLSVNGGRRWLVMGRKVLSVTSIII